MKKQSEPIETLAEIRNMMERSTRFISLNGLSGVFAGIFALAGAGAAFLYLPERGLFYINDSLMPDRSGGLSSYIFIFLDAFLVLFASIAVAVLLSFRKARKSGVKVWDHSARRLLLNLFIPLSAGGVFSLILLFHGFVGLVAPATLIFYGLALVNASKYTLNDIRYLGLIQIVIGLAAAIWFGYGLFFWALGFGLVHIVYGTLMYYKYER